MNYDTISAMIKRHEGLRLKPYLCSEGKKTIGYGWNIDVNRLPRDIEAYLNIYGEITKDMAEHLLYIKITASEADCRDIFSGFYQFTEQRQYALIDMVYNMGVEGICKFKKMRKAITVGDWNEAANQVRDSVYWKQLGGDPIDTDDGKFERPEEIAQMLREG